MNVIDLFAGAGGFSTGASMAGCNVAWAANHWPDAVEWHSRNHPDAAHICQDLHQADWSQVPAHDLMLASPCCQGHSKARGKASGNPQHDARRSTAWAVVSAAEYRRPPAILVENVPEFLDWQLYRPWVLAMQALGYAVSPHVVDAADLGAPQNRIRMFLVLTQSAQPLKLNLPTLDHLPAASFIDFEAGRWQPIEKPGRAAATLERVRAGRAAHGDRFLISYYGNTKDGKIAGSPHRHHHHARSLGHRRWRPHAHAQPVGMPVGHELPRHLPAAGQPPSRRVSARQRGMPYPGQPHHQGAAASRITP